MRRAPLAGLLLALLISACTGQPLGANPSPSIKTTPVAEISPEPTPSPSPTEEPSPIPTPTHAPLLQITKAALHAGEVGIAYAPVTLAATGGLGDFTWSISAGALPAGIAVSTDGTVSGTPTLAGTAFFTVRVADTHGDSAIVNRSIAISRYLRVAGVCTTSAPCAVEAGCVSVCGRFASLSGGVGPFTYTVAPGAFMPAGMSVSGLALAGAFPTPPNGVAAPPPYQFEVDVTDSLGASGKVVAQFTVFNHITLPNVFAGQQGPLAPMTFQMQYFGGLDPATAVLTVDSLPPNSAWTIDTVKKVIIVTVPAQPAGGGRYGATFTVTDNALCGPAPAQHCSTPGRLTFSV